MTLIIENDTGPATQADAASWANQYGLTFPVLADPNNTGWYYISTDPSINGGYGLPNSQLLKPGMEVVKVNGGVYEEDFRQHLDNNR